MNRYFDVIISRIIVMGRIVCFFYFILNFLNFLKVNKFWVMVVIVLMMDFGLRGFYVGEMNVVMFRINLNVIIVDIIYGIMCYFIIEGLFVME